MAGHHRQHGERACSPIELKKGSSAVGSFTAEFDISNVVQANGSLMYWDTDMSRVERGKWTVSAWRDVLPHVRDERNLVPPQKSSTANERGLEID